jgi:hypothetical protein
LSLRRNLPPNVRITAGLGCLGGCGACDDRQNPIEAQPKKGKKECLAGSGNKRTSCCNRFSDSLRSGTRQRNEAVGAFNKKWVNRVCQNLSTRF